MEFLIAGLTIVTLANPILLVCIWFAALTKPRNEYPRWRAIALRIGQLAVTLAELIFWASSIYGPSSNPQRDLYFCRFNPISMSAAAVAFVLAIMGAGTGRRWIALSAVIVPLSWLTSVMVE